MDFPCDSTTDSSLAMRASAGSGCWGSTEGANDTCCRRALEDPGVSREPLLDFLAKASAHGSN
eukprot:726076-Karenia_brevis.AAC.1